MSISNEAVPTRQGCSPAYVLLLEPRFIEMRMFDCLPGQPILRIRLHGRLGCEQAVRGVEGSVGRLDDRRVVILAELTCVGRVRVAFQVARPPPALPFVFGQRHGQAVAAALEIVIDQRPVAILEHEHFGAGAGIRERRVLDRAPGFPTIRRAADHQPFGCGPVVAHVGDERPVLLARE